MDVRRLRQQIKRHEGTGPMREGRFFPYVDSTGHTTIGYGRNLTDRGVSAGEAEILLANDLDETVVALTRFAWWPKLSEVRQRAIADMAFNLGLAGLLTFRGLLAALNNEDWATAGDCMERSRWYGQVGVRGRTLVAMMRTGEDVQP